MARRLGPGKARAEAMAGVRTNARGDGVGPHVQWVDGACGKLTDVRGDDGVSTRWWFQLHREAATMPGRNLRRFDLNLLVALDALLQTGSVTRAGELLNVTQSAMSGELRRLRRMFGDELLVRVGREYELTPLARELIEPVANVLTGIERTIDYRMSFDPAIESRHFSVAMSDYAMLLLLQPLLARTQAEAPGITVAVHAITDQIPKMLGRGGIDLVIGPAFDLSGVHSQLLFTDKSVCIVSADHPDVGDHMSLELFRSLRHLTVHAQPSPSWISDVELDEWGVSQLVSVPKNSFALAPFLVSGTRLATFVPERLARQFGKMAGIRVLTPPVPVPELHETMYWDSVTDTDPAHLWLRQIITDIVGEMS